MSSYTPSSHKLYSTSLSGSLSELPSTTRLRQTWLLWGAAAFLVSVPVFIQAPLVRLVPELSLLLTVGWLWLSLGLRRRPATAVWGDLLLGFTWTWFAGSVYWGWLRWEPLWHLPVEAMGLPFAIWGIARGWGRIGHWFYLGSLFGTVMTDVYFYLVNLIPYWRQLMRVEPSLAGSVLQQAVAQIQTPWGLGWAVVLIALLLVVGSVPLRSTELHWWTFGGAVLSTLLVDGLFWLAATTT